METYIDCYGQKWIFYLNRAGEWRWRRICKNGGLVGISPESYKNKVDCISNAQRNGLTCNHKIIRKLHKEIRRIKDRKVREIIIPIGFSLQFKIRKLRITLMPVGA